MFNSTSDSSSSGVKTEDVGWSSYHPQIASSPPSEVEVSVDDADPTTQKNKHVDQKCENIEETNPSDSTDENCEFPETRRQILFGGCKSIEK